MFGASERMVLPESQSIRGWLLQQSPQMFLGRPPTSPLVVASAGKSSHAPSSIVYVADADHNAALSSAAEWSSAVRHRSPDAYADDDNAEASADSTVSPLRPSSHIIGDRKRLSPSPTEVAPREALLVSPTPHRPDAATSMLFHPCAPAGGAEESGLQLRGSYTPRTVLFKEERTHAQRLVDFMHDCQRVRQSIQTSQQNEFVHLMLLCQRGERAVLRDRDMRFVAHKCRSDSMFSCSRATMTDPFVGFSVPDYISSEVRRVCALESLERRLLESEQERHRLRDVEYPSFRRVAKFTVSRFETLFLKKERMAREQPRRADAPHHSHGLLEGLPPLPPAPSRQQLLEAQVAQLLSELEHSVIPCLREVGWHEAGKEKTELQSTSGATKENTAASSESIRALVEVVSLLHHELRAVGDALVAPSGMQVKSGSSQPKPPSSNTVSHQSGNSTSSRTCSELSSLVSSLLEQNQILVEALAEAEAAGFAIRPQVLEKLKLGPFVV